MENANLVPRDTQLPGQEVEAADLDPTIEPEPDEPDEDRESAAEGRSDPELGNTLIQPDAS